MDKIRELKKLGTLRKSKTYPQYYNIGQFHNGVYDKSGWVSLYTKAAHNVNSPAAFVLQDWASAAFLSKPNIDQASVDLGYSDWRPCNKRFARLLKDTYSLDFKDVFITNLFPYIKPGKMSTHIPARALDLAFKEFCWPQIEVIDPEFVVCLGEAVYNTFARNLNQGQVNAPVGSFFKYENHIIYRQDHPSVRRVSFDTLAARWRAMEEVVRLK